MCCVVQLREGKKFPFLLCEKVGVLGIPPLNGVEVQAKYNNFYLKCDCYFTGIKFTKFGVLL